ncbi:SIS domain-containing protein [Kineothrix sedimenti]|uniref:SIS domain-containing protein n=1 Tax=Kineothrix sedimenti TaxID=3123317 RepID=A0ABZ3F164_9FIRM
MIYKGDICEYIEDTPKILSGIWERRAAIFEDCMKNLMQEKVSVLYLTGTGSSYHSAVAAASFLKKILGIRVFPVYPITISEELCFMNKNSLVIGISQQGTSTAVISGLDEARKAGVRTISVTGEYDTEITSHSDATIYVECGYEDAGATTKGYTATVLTLILFGIGLAGVQGILSDSKEKEYQGRVKRVIDHMPAVLEKSVNWSQKAAESLKDCKNLIVLYDGIMQASMLEAVLKISETCRFPVRGYQTDAFMHGMYNAVDEETEFLYLFPPDKKQKQQLDRLYDYYEKQGNRQYRMPEDYFINDTELSVLEYILPIQMLFVLTSRKRGIDLNIPKDPDFHKFMGSKLEIEKISEDLS